MEIQRLRVLLIEDNPTDILLVEVAFEEMTQVSAELVACSMLRDALKTLEEAVHGNTPFDVALLDLNLPDSHGLDAFQRIAALAPQMPVIALTGLNDEKRALEALQNGASDYLVKGHSEAAVLERSIRYAIERKRTENWRLELARAQTAQAEAEEASRAKDIFLATLSHELRTPLNAILGWAHLLRSGALGEQETTDALEIIERNARAQARLVEDLLDVSRFIAGKMVLLTAVVDLSELVGRGVADVMPDAQHKNVIITAETDEVRLEGDTARLQQLISNLLTNAIKFTPHGGTIAVALKKSEDGVTLQVKDSGEGIEPEMLAFIFDRFRQADGSSTRRHGGLGLGLAIVRTIAELHGGTVCAESEGVGRGATFTVQLPLSRDKN